MITIIILSYDNNKTKRTRPIKGDSVLLSQATG